MPALHCKTALIRFLSWVHFWTAGDIHVYSLPVFKERWLPSVICRYFASYWAVHLVKRSPVFMKFNMLHFAHFTIRLPFEILLSCPRPYSLFLEDDFSITCLLSASRSSSWCLSPRSFCRSYT